jgi:hypothetical protein
LTRKLSVSASRATPGRSRKARILTNDDYIRTGGDIEHATAEDRASVKMFDMQQPCGASRRVGERKS